MRGKRKIEPSQIQRIIQAVVIVAVFLLVLAAVVGRGQSPVAERDNPMPISRFPSDVPVPARGFIHSALLPLQGGQLQEVRLFASASTTTANLALYKHFLTTAAGWQLVAEAGQNSKLAQKSLFAQNGLGMLSVYLSPQSSSTSLIRLIYVTAPALASANH
ncbi:MAG: hypothetical protein KGJ13_05640 [Patescibacteria group bacterium]|nr:hypothetical protein [Patescibacteria group bacterium]